MKLMAKLKLEGISNSFFPSSFFVGSGIWDGEEKIRIRM
jgi:hypothetical protein